VVADDDGSVLDVPGRSVVRDDVVDVEVLAADPGETDDEEEGSHEDLEARADPPHVQSASGELVVLGSDCVRERVPWAIVLPSQTTMYMKAKMGTARSILRGRRKMAPRMIFHSTMEWKSYLAIALHFTIRLGSTLLRYTSFLVSIL